MHTIVFIAPSLVALASFVGWYVTRAKDFNAVSLRLASEEIQAEQENAAWSRALVNRAACNVTLKGY